VPKSWLEQQVRAFTTKLSEYVDLDPSALGSLVPVLLIVVAFLPTLLGPTAPTAGRAQQRTASPAPVPVLSADAWDTVLAQSAVTVVAVGSDEWAAVERLRPAFPSFAFHKAADGLIQTPGVWVIFPKKRRYALTRWSLGDRESCRQWQGFYHRTGSRDSLTQGLARLLERLADGDFSGLREGESSLVSLTADQDKYAPFFG
jgi:hypothetical protein